MTSRSNRDTLIRPGDVRTKAAIHMNVVIGDSKSQMLRVLYGALGLENGQIAF